MKPCCWWPPSSPSLQDPARPTCPISSPESPKRPKFFSKMRLKSLTQETLEQRALMPATRFRPRIGKKPPRTAPPPRLVVRQIVSEYSVGALKDAAEPNLTEFRQVISVDGRKVQTAERARHALSLGITSPDDRVRKRMLEDFANHGLVDIATDYGIFLLAFSKRGLENMKCHLRRRRSRSAPTPPGCSTWQQTSPDAGMLAIRRQPGLPPRPAGPILVRKSDGLPLRIQSWTKPPRIDQRASSSGPAAPPPMIRDEATVDYVRPRTAS